MFRSWIFLAISSSSIVSYALVECWPQHCPCR